MPPVSQTIHAKNNLAAIKSGIPTSHCQYFSICRKQKTGFIIHLNRQASLYSSSGQKVLPITPNNNKYANASYNNTVSPHRNKITVLFRSLVWILGTGQLSNERANERTLWGVKLNHWCFIGVFIAVVEKPMRGQTHQGCLCSGKIRFIFWCR